MTVKFVRYSTCICRKVSCHAYAQVSNSYCTNDTGSLCRYCLMLVPPGTLRVKHDPEKWNAGYRTRSCSRKNRAPY